MLPHENPQVDKVAHIFQHKYHLSSSDMEDLKSDITLRLLELEQSGDKRLADEAYLHTVVNNAARDFLHFYVNRANREAPLPPSMAAPSDMDTELLVEDLLSSLPPTSQQVMRMYFGIGVDTPIRWMRRIAKEVGITEGTARQAFDSGMRLLAKKAAQNT